MCCSPVLRLQAFWSLTKLHCLEHPHYDSEMSKLFVKYFEVPGCWNWNVWGPGLFCAVATQFSPEPTWIEDVIGVVESKCSQFSGVRQHHEYLSGCYVLLPCCYQVFDPNARLNLFKLIRCHRYATIKTQIRFHALNRPISWSSASRRSRYKPTTLTWKLIGC